MIIKKIKDNKKEIKKNYKKLKKKIFKIYNIKAIW